MLTSFVFSRPWRTKGCLYSTFSMNRSAFRPQLDFPAYVQTLYGALYAGAGFTRMFVQLRWSFTVLGQIFLRAPSKARSELLYIQCNAVTLEVENAMSYVERYHAPLRRAFWIIEEECETTSFDGCLQTAVKAVYDIVGPDGLVPTLLVFGTYARLGFDGDPPHPSTADCAAALRKAKDDLTKNFARRQVSGACSTQWSEYLGGAPHPPRLPHACLSWKGHPEIHCLGWPF